MTTRTMHAVMEEYRKTHHPGRWGTWHYTPKDYCLNLVREHELHGHKFNDTLDNPFYYVRLNEINSYKDIFRWVNQLTFKNEALYGDKVASDLILAFNSIMRTAVRKNFIPLNAVSWSGEELAKNYSKYIRKTVVAEVSKSLRLDVLARDKSTCQICGAKAPDVKLHIDHKMPKSKGGTNDISNLWTLCEACNLGKSDKVLDLDRS